ncbi:hypothetical protein E2562_016809 [Oryza meyeriana var. granulata]|uniref:BTB domain-containing protein n=1 Tax=Oryza meyeriana var. granulata TaxID=110450 RepID=A0A6G1BXB3_9ORYZ|nr:hypothetical protein E2562_016809 [Oryza meyeriana var. granulata]
MLEDGVIADVEFSVRTESFCAHACVLAARSPVFMAELLRPAAAWHRACNLQALQRRLLVAADRYGVDRRRAMCEAKLCESIAVET